MRRLLLAMIYLYQKLLSPCLPARCRYYPTCSEYGKQALLWHGGYRGLKLLVRRLLRCHPFGGSGVDFVPLPLYRYRFYPSNQSWHCVYLDVFSYRKRLTHLMKN